MSIGVLKLQGCIPVTLELESPSITVGSAGVCLEPSSVAPRAGAPFPATLMKLARWDDRYNGGLCDRQRLLECAGNDAVARCTLRIRRLHR